MSKQVSKETIKKCITKTGKLNPNLFNKMGITKQEAYNTYYDKNEFCVDCNKKLKFLSFSKGYKKCVCYPKGITITKELVKNACSETGRLNKDYFRNTSLSEKDLYDISFPGKSLCDCGEPKVFISFYRGYKRSCCNPICINKLGTEKRKNTCLLKYGVEHTSQLSENRDKMRKEYNKNINKHRKNMSIGQSKVDQKMKMERSKITKLNRYGDENYNNPDKASNTCLLRYNVKNILDIYRKTGFDNYTYSHVKNKQKYTEEGFRKFIKDDKFLIEECSSFFNITRDACNKIKIRYNIDQPNKLDIVHIEERINSEFNNSFIVRTKQIIKPLELDLYSKEYNMAIEYNGLMWHSYGISKHSIFNNVDKEDKNRHLNKTLLCEEKGIQLYHIFENEWLDETKKSIWISVLKDKQGLNTKIGARKCTIGYPSKQETKEFLNENHLQGFGLSPISIGLYLDTGDFYPKLMSIMTFGKSRFNKNIEYELIRFCTKKGYSVQGGASRLLKAFERKYKPKSLISYANRRWSTGNLYRTIGFTFLRDVAPNYFYFLPKENILWSRNKFQKHKLNNLLESFNIEETESQNMFNNGYRRIWDSGNKVYVKEYKK